MAKNNKAAAAAEASAEERVAATETAGVRDSKASGNKRKSNSRRRNSNGRRRNDVKPANQTLQQMAYDGPAARTANEMLFPSESASMGAFGSFTTTPGQDNFVQEFNHVTSIIPGTTPLTFAASAIAKRTANVMRLGVTPWFGAVEPRHAYWISNPLQMAAANLKQFIDTSFGTRTDYDPQDLMLYLMAVSSVFPMIAEIKRDLRLAITSIEGQYPQFVPQGIYSALRISDADGNYANGEGLLYTTRNLRSYIDQLNQYITMFNRLPMPPEILAFGYNDDFFDAIYMDSEDVQTAQLYAFSLDGWWMYAEGSFNGADLLRFETDRERSIEYKLANLRLAITNISNLRTSSTAMLQNLFNAYGSRDTVTVPLVDINEMKPLEFMYHPGILTMIENAVLLKSSVHFSRVWADHEAAALHGYVYYPKSETTGADIINLPLQFHKAPRDVTQEDIGWAMRLHPAFLTLENVKDTAATADPTEAYSTSGYTGFAFLTSMAITYMRDDGTTRTITYGRRDINNFTNATFMLYLHDFSTSPIFYVATTDETEGTYSLDVYNANRDVEVTYRLEDMHMFWVYLTQTMWASTVNRNVLGTRIKG